MTHQPTLWRGRSYSLPGFPRPTMTFTGSSSALRPNGTRKKSKTDSKNAARISSKWVKPLFGLALFLGLRLPNELGLRRGLRHGRDLGGRRLDDGLRRRDDDHRRVFVVEHRYAL